MSKERTAPLGRTTGRLARRRGIRRRRLHLGRAGGPVRLTGGPADSRRHPSDRPPGWPVTHQSATQTVSSSCCLLHLTMDCSFFQLLDVTARERAPDPGQGDAAAARASHETPAAATRRQQCKRSTARLLVVVVAPQIIRPPPLHCPGGRRGHGPRRPSRGGALGDSSDYV